MIRGGFLSEEDRNKLIALAREGSVASRVTRRANALVLLDDGWSCQEVADAFLLNDDTIRGWFKLFEQRGIEGLTSFDVGGSASFLSAEQEDALKAFVGATLPRSTRQVGAFIEQEFGLVYESRSGLIALLHRLGLEYHKPDIIPRKLNKEKQQAFIESYDNLLNSLADNEAVLFADAVHPTHAAREAYCVVPGSPKCGIQPWLSPARGLRRDTLWQGGDHSRNSRRNFPTRRAARHSCSNVAGRMVLCVRPAVATAPPR